MKTLTQEWEEKFDELRKESLEYDKECKFCIEDLKKDKQFLAEHEKAVREAAIKECIEIFRDNKVEALIQLLNK